MNMGDIQSAIEYLQNHSDCPGCGKKPDINDINIIATTKIEGLFEIKCNNCNYSSIVNVIMNPEMEIKPTKPPAAVAPTSQVDIGFPNMGRKHRKISQDDVLDIRNFLNNFDGNFKKIFTKKTNEK